jgi:hypothetical protein
MPGRVLGHKPDPKFKYIIFIPGTNVRHEVISRKVAHEVVKGHFKDIELPAEEYEPDHLRFYSRNWGWVHVTWEEVKSDA